MELVRQYDTTMIPSLTNTWIRWYFKSTLIFCCFVVLFSPVAMEPSLRQNIVTAAGESECPIWDKRCESETASYAT